MRIDKYVGPILRSQKDFASETKSSHRPTISNSLSIRALFFLCDSQA